MSRKPKEQVIKICKECRKEFKTVRKDRRFCCDKCRNKFWVNNFRHTDRDRLIE